MSNLPPLDEPSVLDYLKSKLKFWARDNGTQLTPEPHTEETVQAPALAAEAKPASAVVNRVPWRSLLALGFALVAQFSMEPSANRSAGKGLFLYAISIGLLVWAITTREWSLSPLEPSAEVTGTIKVRVLPLLLGIPLAALAFLFMGGNLFTIPNVILWLLAIACFVLAFWTPSGKPAFWERLASFFRRDSWQIKITWGTILVLVVVGVVVFFRLYNLSGVPSEPFSDHAEKILDVYDVSQGQTHIFFPRNTGREAIQMYLTLVVSWIFGTGLSFLSLKIGTVIVGLLTLPYIYLLGKEFGGKRLGMLAFFLAGIAYWPNVISRVGLRFPLYPMFVAPTLYYLLRGLRTRQSNDFIIAGLFLGLGLHGYSPFRIMPIVVVIAFGLYLLHRQSRGARKQAVGWLALTVLVSFIVFLPLARYWFDNPGSFTLRAFSRLGAEDAALPGSPVSIFFSNLWNALKMFNWDDGQIWVHSVTYRPALDVVSGALFILGIILLLVRYIRERHWLDLFLLLSVPLLQLPSILSLAFPTENPALNRAGGALVPTFIIVAAGLDGLLGSIARSMARRSAVALNWAVVLILLVTSSLQNFNLVFDKYATQFTAGAWNSSEMGAVIKQFKATYGTTDNVWIVPYPYWVDTRLPGVWAGIPNRDFALWQQDFSSTLNIRGPKLIMLNTADTADVNTLEKLYPQGTLSVFHSSTHIEGKDFLEFFIPPEE